MDAGFNNMHSIVKKYDSSLIIIFIFRFARFKDVHLEWNNNLNTTKNF
jgi:hypothetical protein